MNNAEEVTHACNISAHYNTAQYKMLSTIWMCIVTAPSQGRHNIYGTNRSKFILYICHLSHTHTYTKGHSTTAKQKVPIIFLLTLKVLVVTIDAQWEGMGDVGSARYEPALLPPCPTIRILSYSN